MNNLSFRRNRRVGLILGARDRCMFCFFFFIVLLKLIIQFRKFHWTEICITDRKSDHHGDRKECIEIVRYRSHEQRKAVSSVNKAGDSRSP